MEELKPFIANLSQMIEFARGGIVSKTVIDNQDTKVVHFSMEKGQSLSEHTAGTPATIFVTNGRAKIQLGSETHDAEPGTFIYMPAKLVHAVNAEEDLVFVLTLIRGA